MNWFGTAKDLVAKVNEIHEKFIETQTEFRLLRDQTNRTFEEFRSALTRIAEKVETQTLDRTKDVADLRAEIRGLELRLNALSEHALHAVAEKMARSAINALPHGESTVRQPMLPASSSDSE
jgi:hypothetical protein